MADNPTGRYRHARTDALIGIALLSSAVFIWLIAVPAFGPPRIARHVGHLPVLYGHIVNGAVMLISGAIALRIGLTRDWFRWHKPAGYTYLATGSIASVLALICHSTPSIRRDCRPARWRWCGWRFRRWRFGRSATGASTSIARG